MNRKEPPSDVDSLERQMLHGILSGRYRANECLPAIDHLCASFGVAYQTVRLALRRHIARGLLGEGERVVELQSSIDLRLLFEVIDQVAADPARKWTLAAQACGFLRFMLNEIADRAARHRDDSQLEWLRHLIRQLSDRVSIQSPRPAIAQSELEICRVLAAASGCITHTAVINSMKPLFSCEVLVSKRSCVVPVDDYWALLDAVAGKDPARAREVIDAAWWRLEEHCIEELKKLGWTETPTGATPGSP